MLDCSPCTTRLFSTSYAARHFQTVPHSSELNSLAGCIWQHVLRRTDIILDEICLRMQSGHNQFPAPVLSKFWDFTKRNGVVLSSMRW